MLYIRQGFIELNLKFYLRITRCRCCKFFIKNMLHDGEFVLVVIRETYKKNVWV